VFRLVSKVHAGLDSVVQHAADARAALCALGRDGSESLDAAHERDAAQCREVVARHPRALLTALPGPGRPAPLIAPGPEMAALWEESLERSNRVAGGTGDGPPAGVLSSAAPTRTVRKKTTAASFFGSTSSGSAPAAGAASSSSSKPTKSAPAPAPGGVAKSKSEDEKENKESSSSRAKGLEPKKRLVAPKSNAKKVATATNANGCAKIGNADDFVGDMDTDSEQESNGDGDVSMRDANGGDDDEGEDEQPLSPSPDRPSRKRAPSKAANPRQARTASADDGLDEDDDSVAAPAKSGAMDAFAAVVPAGKPASVRGRKRVVERTFQDEHGYLQTELQEVWDDAPAEETVSTGGAAATAAITTTSARPKPAATNPTAKSKSSNKSSLKQGSLKGFFSKK
jgi:hypothetical protein